MPVASEEVEQYGSEDHADDCIPNGHASITPPPALIAVVWKHIAIINVIVTVLPVDQLFCSSPRHSDWRVKCVDYRESSFLLSARADVRQDSQASTVCKRCCRPTMRVNANYCRCRTVLFQPGLDLDAGLRMM